MKLSIFWRTFPSLFLGLIVNASAQTTSPLLICNQSHYDAGATRVINGEAIATHQFVLRNESDHDVNIHQVVISCGCVKAHCPALIKAHAQGIVDAVMHLAPSQFEGKKVDLIIDTDDKNRENLQLSIAASAAYTPYAIPKYADFNSLIPNFPKTISIYIFYPSASKLDKFLQNIYTTMSHGLTASVLWQKCQEEKSASGSNLFMYSALVNVSMKAGKDLKVNSSPSDPHPPLLIIHLSTGDQLSLPITWNIAQEEVFNPSNMDLGNVTLGESAAGQIAYYPTIGGKPDIIDIQGSGLALEHQTLIEGVIICQFRYTPKESHPKQSVGFLSVKTKDGQLYRADINASSESP